METIIKWVDRPAVLLWIAIVFGLLALVFMGICFDLGKSDWASWVQAIGSIAAIGGALWTFRKQVQLQRSDAAVISKLASARIHPRLENLIVEYELLVKRLEEVAAFDKDPNVIRGMYEQVRKPPDWTVEELSKLAPLPEECALHLAKGLGYLTTMRLHMREFVNSSELDHSNVFRRREAQKAADNLSRAIGKLSVAANIMEAQNA